MSISDDRINKRIREIIDYLKTHAESREYKNAFENKGKIFKTQLGFDDTEINDKFLDFKIEWHVEYRDLEKTNTISAKILMDNKRIRGIDHNNARPSFKFDKATKLTSHWHENIIFSEDGLLGGINNHEPLDWSNKYSENINRFAVKVAEHWNIESWSEDEQDWLPNFEE